jgi:hypothetical protein
LIVSVGQTGGVTTVRAASLAAADQPTQPAEGQPTQPVQPRVPLRRPAAPT